MNIIITTYWHLLDCSIRSPRIFSSVRTKQSRSGRAQSLVTRIIYGRRWLTRVLYKRWIMILSHVIFFIWKDKLHMGNRKVSGSFGSFEGVIWWFFLSRNYWKSCLHVTLKYRVLPYNLRVPLMFRHELLSVNQSYPNDPEIVCS